MKLKIELSQVGSRTKSIETEISEQTTMVTLKKLWEIEQFLNNLQGANLRVHINVEHQDGK